MVKLNKSRFIKSALKTHAEFGCLDNCYFYEKNSTFILNGVSLDLTPSWFRMGVFYYPLYCATDFVHMGYVDAEFGEEGSREVPQSELLEMLTEKTLESSELRKRTASAKGFEEFLVSNRKLKLENDPIYQYVYAVTLVLLSRKEEALELLQHISNSSNKGPTAFRIPELAQELQAAVNLGENCAADWISKQCDRKIATLSINDLRVTF